MNTNKKITYAQAIDVAIAHLNAETNAEYITRLNELKVALAKKYAKGGATKTQKANSAMATAIVEYCSANGFEGTVSDFIKTLPTLADLSTQKVSPILNGLVKDGLFTKAVVKGKAIFSLATDTAED